MLSRSQSLPMTAGEQFANLPVRRKWDFLRKRQKIDYNFLCLFLATHFLIFFPKKAKVILTKMITIR